MNDIIIIILSIWFAFGAGLIIPFLFGRGLYGLHIKAFLSGKVLIRVHLRKGGAVYRLGQAVEGGSMVAWAMNSKKDLRYSSLNPAAIVRAVRVRWLDVDENDTAPYVYNKVVPFEQEIEVARFSKDQDEEKEAAIKKGELLTEKVKITAYKVFEAWNDNAVVRQLYQWALMRPRRKLPGLGLDIKTIIIILVIIAGVVLFVMQIQSGAAPTPPGNVIG